MRSEYYYWLYTRLRDNNGVSPGDPPPESAFSLVKKEPDSYGVCARCSVLTIPLCAIFTVSKRSRHPILTWRGGVNLGGDGYLHPYHQLCRRNKDKPANPYLSRDRNF